MEPPPFPLDQLATTGWSEPLPPQLLELPKAGSRSWQEHVHHILESLPQQTALVVRARDHQLGISDLRDLKRWLHAEDHRLLAITTHCATTLVAARASGVPAWREPLTDGEDNHLLHVAQPQAKDPGSTIEAHIGTLRSGHHLAVDDSILLLGDVNPGATISAGGHILVWGRLRGVAHAGNPGDTAARIAALHLRPVQLRIAALVARGPEESPPPGQAEQALIRDGKIRIEPAEAGWTKGLSLRQLPAIPWLPRLASS